MVHYNEKYGNYKNAISSWKRADALAVLGIFLQVTTIFSALLTWRHKEKYIEWLALWSIGCRHRQSGLCAYYPTFGNGAIFGQRNGHPRAIFLSRHPAIRHLFLSLSRVADYPNLRRNSHVDSVHNADSDIIESSITDDFNSISWTDNLPLSCVYVRKLDQFRQLTDDEDEPLINNHRAVQDINRRVVRVSVWVSQTKDGLTELRLFLNFVILFIIVILTFLKMRIYSEYSIQLTIHFQSLKMVL